MKSTLLGNFQLDAERLAGDLAVLEQHPPAPEYYSEFRLGTFHTYNLRNPSSDVNDRGLNAGQKPAERTSLGTRLAYIDEILDALFDPAAIRMVRVMEISAGVLFPHRDMIEFGEAGRKNARIHLMLKTNPTAMHSESDDVFRMEAGDLWYLNVDGIHAAINRMATSRYTLVVDLDDTKFDYRSLPERRGVRPAAPTIVSRGVLGEEEVDRLMAMRILVSPHNALDFFQMFAKLHFYKDISTDRTVSLTKQFFEGTSEEQTAADFIEYLVEKRSLQQRFFLNERWMDF